MEIRPIDPIAYHDWDKLLLQSGDSQFFHTRAWARVLNESYGYKPVYFALLEGNCLAFLLPFVEVNSLFTGKRGASLPFSDFCPPFTQEKAVPPSFPEQIIAHGKKANWRYLEFRAAETLFPEQLPKEVYLTHDLNLSRSDHEIFSDFKDSTKRNIRKAEKSGLSLEIDDSLDSLKRFYRLQCLTRKRLGFPPQPFSFFRRIHDHVNSQGYGTVVSAFHSNTCVASSVYFLFGKQAIFKFGASDLRYQDLRPNNLVMWEAIKWLKERGFQTLNFGRTNTEDQGLIRYKRSWGTVEREIRYFCYDLNTNSFTTKVRDASRHRELFRLMPIPVLRLIGRLVYKHLG